MSKLANAVTAIAAAGALATGGALYYMSDDLPKDEPAENVDDVVAVTVDLPKVELPVVSVPGVKAPEVDTPQIVTPEIVITKFVSALELDKLNIPAAEVQAVSATPRIVLLPMPQGVKVVLPEVSDPAERIPLVIELQRTLQTLFRDKRNLAYDRSIGIDSTAWKKWIEIYRKNEPYAIAYQPMPAGLRIIAEVKCPQDSAQIETLDKNLEAYKAAGYNAVLLTFDLTEPLSKLLDVISFVKSKDMRVVFAYAGPERLEWSVFQDPDKIADYLSSIGAASDAFLIGWRRTSLHLLIPDPQWINFLVKNARKCNQDLPVIGEAYLGQTAESNESERAVTYNIPENISAVLIFGIGYKGVAIERAIDLVFPQAKGLPRIGLAIGERPYFDTRNDTKKSMAENNKIKAKIESRFLRAGCIGTMTIRGDGSDGIYDKTVTENLCLPYKEEAGRK